MVYVRASDGMKIAVFDWNPQGEQTVVLIHGWPFSHKIYEYQIQLLLQYGYRVIAVDLRGFGKSDIAAYNYCYDRMAEDIYNVVCAFKVKRFILMGFSMGGAIALRYMRRFRSYGVERLILLSATAPCWTQKEDFPYGVTMEFVNQLLYLASRDRPQLCRDLSQQLFENPKTQASIDWFEDIMLSTCGIGMIQSCLSMRNEDGRDDIKWVDVPTWIIHGGKDQIVPSDLAQILHEGIPKSKLHILENSGHGIMYDELEDFNSFILMAIEEKL